MSGGNERKKCGNMTGLKITTYDKKKKENIVAGYFVGSTFIKPVKKTHFMKVEGGYGIQEDVIQKLIKLNCSHVLIRTSVFSYTIDFNEYITAIPKDYGHGKQRFVRIIF